MTSSNNKSPTEEPRIASEERSYDFLNGEVIADKVLGFYQRISYTAENEELAVALTSTFLMAIVNADAARESNLRAVSENNDTLQ